MWRARRSGLIERLSARQPRKTDDQARAAVACRFNTAGLGSMPSLKGQTRPGQAKLSSSLSESLGQLTPTAAPYSHSLVISTQTSCGPRPRTHRRPAGLLLLCAQARALPHPGICIWVYRHSMVRSFDRVLWMVVVWRPAAFQLLSLSLATYLPNARTPDPNHRTRIHMT